MLQVEFDAVGGVAAQPGSCVIAKKLFSVVLGRLQPNPSSPNLKNFYNPRFPLL
jgi:hypothetical protein